MGEAVARPHDEVVERVIGVHHQRLVAVGLTLPGGHVDVMARLGPWRIGRREGLGLDGGIGF